MKIRLSFKARMVGSSVLVVLCTLACISFFLHRSLREQMISQLREVFEQRITFIKEAIEHSPSLELSPSSLDRLADRLGHQTGSRVTLLRPDGTVLGDSNLTPDEISSATKESSRPEIRGVLEKGKEWSIRPDLETDHEVMFLAEIIGELDHPLLIMRISRPMSDLDGKLGRVRRILFWSSLLGMILSLGVAWLVANHIFNPVTELTKTAMNISSGKLHHRLRRYPNHEIGDLGRALDRMADHLQEEIEAVTRARDRLEAILRGMVEGVLVTDSNGRITQANRALRELLDLQTHPLGRRPSEMVRNADLIEAVRQVAEGAPYSKLEIRTRGKHPRILEVEVAALPGEGPRSGVVAVFHDITERHRIEQMRRDFVANVSHELRTPLAAVRGAVETLLDGALEKPKYAKKFTEVINRQVKRLESLVLDLLNLARMESGEAGPSTDQVPLNSLIESSLSAVNELASARSVTLLKEIESAVVYVIGDPRMLEQALVNLLENAVKYTEGGGLVTLRVYDEKQEVHLAVTDTGMGISKEHLSRIFERFYRVNKDRSREMGGTGLGLAIVKHVAQAHGGRVEVDSFPGKGSTFTLVLPPLKHSGIPGNDYFPAGTVTDSNISSR